jgi:hypothetical protein
MSTWRTVWRTSLTCIFRAGIRLIYASDVDSDVWVGAAATLAGALLGGVISFVLSRQQINAARDQRNEEAARAQQERSEDRRYQVYSDFLTRARSCRKTLQAYYLHADNRPSIAEIDVTFHAVSDSPALVFLVVETEGAYNGCRAVLRAFWKAQRIIHGLDSASADDPWSEINNNLEGAMREFQNAARDEPGVTGPARPWSTYYETSHPDILAELKRSAP